MTSFWENAFSEKKEMWGMEPAVSAVITRDFFSKESVKTVLIPGIGYGRNAEPFITAGMSVTGIEISETAIELARKHLGKETTIYHGSVGDMPFDQEAYDGIFCHAVIHLLDENERQKLLHDCYNQLVPNGLMVFTAVTKDAPNYGKGKLISQDRYEFHEGAKIFHYDRDSVQAEFAPFGLVEIIDVNENQPMFLIKCTKSNVSISEID